MIQSAVTVSIVEQARQGPFVFHSDVAAAVETSAALGFDAIELFAPSAQEIRRLPLATLLRQSNLKLAAVGTGAGMLIHQLHLCSLNAERRREAREFIRGIVDAGAEFGAPAIIGSMQGRWDQNADRETATSWLREALDDLGQHAAARGTFLLYEPLNRYETNLATTLEQGAELLQPLSGNNVRLLADLFHMNIEESDPAQALRTAGGLIGHVHFVDSNRQAAGRGHLDFVPLAAALRDIGYTGYASAEALPIPDSESAARTTITTFRQVFH